MLAQHVGIVFKPCQHENVGENLKKCWPTFLNIFKNVGQHFSKANMLIKRPTCCSNRANMLARFGPSLNFISHVAPTCWCKMNQHVGTVWTEILTSLPTLIRSISNSNSNAINIQNEVWNTVRTFECWRNMLAACSNRTNMKMLARCWPTFLNMFKNVGQHFLEGQHAVQEANMLFKLYQHVGHQHVGATCWHGLAVASKMYNNCFEQKILTDLRFSPHYTLYYVIFYVSYIAMSSLFFYYYLIHDIHHVIFLCL